MRFLLDENMPVSLVAWLERRGHLAEHVIPLGLSAATDGAIAAYADKIGAVIVTKDTDFRHPPLAESARQVLLIGMGNMSTRALMARLESVWTEILTALKAGQPLIELR